MTFGATGLVTMEYDADFWLENFSKDPESRAISEEDFVKGMKEWISQVRQWGRSAALGGLRMLFADYFILSATPHLRQSRCCAPPMFVEASKVAIVCDAGCF